MFNSEGNVVGVSKASTDTSTKFIGISDLKAQIETMINEHGIMYCGITGQNVTDELAAKYGLQVVYTYLMWILIHLLIMQDCRQEM